MIVQGGAGSQSINISNQTIDSSYSAGDIIGVYEPRFEQGDNFSSGNGAYGRVATNEVRLAQIIVIPYDIYITSFSSLFAKTGTPTNITQVRIETDSAGSPSGSLVNANAVCTFTNSTFTGTFTLYTSNFTAPFKLSAGTYHIVFQVDTGNSNTNYPQVCSSTNSWVPTLFPTITAVSKKYDGTSWAINGTSYLRYKFNNTKQSLLKIQNAGNRLYDESFKEVLGIVQSTGSAGSAANIKTMTSGLKDNTVSGLTPYKYSSVTLGEVLFNYAWNNSDSQRVILYSNRDSTLIVSKTRYLRYNGNDSHLAFNRVLTYSGKGIIKSLLVSIQGTSSTNVFGYRLIIDGVTVIDNSDSSSSTGILGYLSPFGSGTSINRYTLPTTNPSLPINIPFESSVEIQILNTKASPVNDIRLNIDSN